MKILIISLILVRSALITAVPVIQSIIQPAPSSWFQLYNDTWGWEIQEEWDDLITGGMEGGFLYYPFTLSLGSSTLTLRGEESGNALRLDEITMESAYNLLWQVNPLLTLNTTAGVNLLLCGDFMGLYFQQFWHRLMGIPRSVPETYDLAFYAGELFLHNTTSFNLPLIINLDGMAALDWNMDFTLEGGIQLLFPASLIEGGVQLRWHQSSYLAKPQVLREITTQENGPWLDTWLNFNHLFVSKELNLITRMQNGRIGFILNKAAPGNKAVETTLSLGMPLFNNSYFGQLSFAVQTTPVHLALSGYFQNGFIQGMAISTDAYRFSEWGLGGDVRFGKLSFLELSFLELYGDMLAGLCREQHHSATLYHSRILETKVSGFLKSGIGFRFSIKSPFPEEKKIQYGLDFSYNLRVMLLGDSFQPLLRHYGTIAFCIRQDSS